MNTNIGSYYNFCGSVLEASKLKIPSEDEKVYEVIRIVDGKPLFFEDHMNRMKSSFERSGEFILLDFEKIKSRIVALTAQNGYKNCNVKLLGAYGEAEAGENRLLIYVSSFSYPDADMYKNGVDTVSVNIERQDPNSKIMHDGYKNYIAERLEKTGAYEALLVSADGYITEGSRSNMFFIKGGEVFTAPLDLVLPGVTRKYVLEACKNSGLTINEVSIKLSDMSEFDGVFMSGTSINALPIRRVDDTAFNTANLTAYLRIKEEYERIMQKDA